jgi:hypothetical protein
MEGEGGEAPATPGSLSEAEASGKKRQHSWRQICRLPAELLLALISTWKQVRVGSFRGRAHGGFEAASMSPLRFMSVSARALLLNRFKYLTTIFF